MKIVTSVSGGMTSAYMADKFPTDHLVFALVRIEDQKSRFKDEVIRKQVEDRIQAPFIATAEDDMIIYTMLDLEQYLGKKIDWVTGLTFDEIIKVKGGYLPNTQQRYCTTWMKIVPIFEWWTRNFNEPIIMNIGYRGNEGGRVLKMNKTLTENGFSTLKYAFEKHVGGRHDGNNKWENIEWRKPAFPLHDNGILKDTITEYWKDKPVRFAPMNNCVGCFHREVMLLKKMHQMHPEKIEWFASQEGGDNGYFKPEITYEQIMKHRLQLELEFDDFGGCDSGDCEL